MRKGTKRETILGFVSIILSVVLFVRMFYVFGDRIGVLRNILGKEIKVQRDTLTAVDYRLLFETIILSNGLEVDLRYAESNLIEVAE